MALGRLPVAGPAFCAVARRYTRRLPNSLWIHTMNRCLAPALLGLALLLPAAHAQVVVREAPRDVVPARMAVGNPPEITLDGEPARLSPGARIRDPRNLQVLSGSLSGQSVPVVYRRDTMGLVHEVWILTPDEYARVQGLAPTNPEGAAALHRLLTAIFTGR